MSRLEGSESEQMTNEIATRKRQWNQENSRENMLGVIRLRPKAPSKALETRLQQDKFRPIFSACLQFPAILQELCENRNLGRSCKLTLAGGIAKLECEMGREIADSQAAGPSGRTYQVLSTPTVTKVHSLFELEAPFTV